MLGISQYVWFGWEGSKALNNPDKDLTNPNAYLWRITHNYLVDYIKHKSKIPQTFVLDENLDFLDESMENLRSSHFQAKVQDLMQCVEQNLHGIEYKIVQLVIMYDQTAVTAASELNLKPANVRQKLSRSLKKLKANCLELWNANHHQF
jgi:RNA polymerase sigma factor (sigma-70 family)